MSKGWQNRIISYGVKPADQFMAHPDNARLHPQIQREAVKASLDTLGWIAPVIESASGYLVDGHERLWQALQNNDDVPFIVVNLTPEEEKTALLTFDPITGLATYDTEKLDALLREVNTDSPALQQMLSNLGARVGVIPTDDPYEEWQGMPEFSPDPLAFRSLHVHFKSQEDVDAFAEIIQQQITDKTRSIWYPYQEKRDIKSLVYSTDES